MKSHFVTKQTEIRPGTYLYNDVNTLRAGFCSLDDCAASIVCTVVSTAAERGKVVIDAGTKTLTSDRNVTAPDSGHGHVVEYPEAVIVRLSEEHGEIDVSGCGIKPRVSERVRTSRFASVTAVGAWPRDPWRGLVDGVSAGEP